MIKSRGVYSAMKMVMVHVEIVYTLLASKVEEVLKQGGPGGLGDVGHGGLGCDGAGHMGRCHRLS